jgi:hypothetical protein
MSNAAGTIQTILLQLAGVLEPLERELAPGRARETLAELGVVLTAGQVNSIAGPLQTIVGNTRDLLQLASELTAAIEAENVGQVVSKSLGLVENAVSTIESFDDLKTAVDAIGSVPQQVVDELPERLFNLLLIKALEQARGVNELLELLGILNREHFNEGSSDPNNPPFTVSTLDFGRVGQWLSSPADALDELYGWGTASLDSPKLLARLENLLLHLDAPAFFDETASPPTLHIALIEVTEAAGNPEGLQALFRSEISTGTITFAEDDWRIEFELGARLPFDTGVRIRPGEFTIIPPSGNSFSGNVRFRFIGDRTGAAEPFIVIGEAGGSQLSVRRFVAEVGGGFRMDGGQAEGDVNVGGSVEGGRLFVSFENSDGFIGKLLAGVRLESDFDLGFNYSTADGLHFTGSSTLEIQLPIHLSLGPVEISALTISVGIDGQRFPVGIGLDIAAMLGPLQAVVQGIGVEAVFELRDGRDGNAGPLDIGVGFKPPRGVGLSIDTGVVRGGGFLLLDFDKGEYAGVCELSIAELVTVKAIGLINTKMPDGSDGFSLLIIISAEFQPIQLGFGFTLNAVGGLLGLNRTVVLDALRQGVRTGAVNSIMFPRNVVANAPRIISDLKAIFPPHNGKFLIGPMAKFGWGTPPLITLSFGLIIEIPGNIAILGVLKIALPHEAAALVLIQVNFVGTLDFDKKMLTFDASLFESRILFITLEGDMAVRFRWGDDPAFLLSVGGFHPSFEPPPLALPTLRRISASILNYSWARIRVECYYAVTSNTVQWGARAELFFGVDGCNVSGDIGYDVLFQFSPFYFIAEIRGRLSLEVIGIDVLSIRLRFALSGPGPWRAKGTGSVSILFWDIDVDFDVTWGEEKNTTLPPIEVLPLLVAELGQKDNWRAIPPASNNLLVSLRELDPELLVLHPVGALAVTQRAVPLAFTLDKVGNKKPSDVNRVELTAATSGATVFTLSAVEESFAPAQFEEMTDAQKLSRASFEKLPGGATISLGGSTFQSSKVTRRKIEYEVTIIDEEPVKPLPFGRLLAAAAGLFFSFVRGAAVAQSKLSHNYKVQAQPFGADKVAVESEGYTVAFAHDNTAFGGSASFASEALAHDYMKQHLAANPSLKGTLHVVPNFEVNS